MNSPQFSIIIPVYKAAEYLTPLMKQLQNQTLQNFEVLFVNDCSPDNSADILTLLAKNDKRVRVFHHETNKGQGVARNTGLDNARGEYILYIDADDSVTHNYLESLLDGIKRYDADVAICNSIWVYHNREVRHNMFINNPDLPELLITGEEALERYYFIFKDDFRLRVEPWGRIIRRSMIEKNHLRYQESRHEDVVMGFSELLFSKKVMLLNEYLYYYNRKNNACDTLERKREYLKDFPYIYLGFKKVLVDHGSYEQFGKWMTRFYFCIVSWVYEAYSKGEDLSDEMHEAILHYRTLLHDPLIEGSEDYISIHLMKFRLQMKRNKLSDIYLLFIDAHPEVHSLIRKNFRYCIMCCINRFYRYKSVQNVCKRIITDPHTDMRRIPIRNMNLIFKQFLSRIQKNYKN